MGVPSHIIVDIGGQSSCRRDHRLAVALATLFRYVGPRVSEVAALQIPDVQVSARRGLLIIRKGDCLTMVEDSWNHACLKRSTRLYYDT